MKAPGATTSPTALTPARSLEQRPRGGAVDGGLLPADAAGRVFQAGFTRDQLWLRATVVNTLPQRPRFGWRLYALLQPGGRGLAPGRRVAAGARGFPARASCLPFWLEAYAHAVVYLAVENHTGATYLPTDFTTAEDSLTYEQAFFSTKRWIWLLGLCLGSASLNLVLIAFLRDRRHLWYGAYIVFAAWFWLGRAGALCPRARVMNRCPATCPCYLK